MLKTFLASTAIASSVALAGYAQEATQPATPGEAPPAVLVEPTEDGTQDAADTSTTPGSDGMLAPADSTAQDTPDAGGMMAPADSTAQDAPPAMPDADGTMAPAADTAEGMSPEMGQTLSPVVMGDISTEDLIGTQIQTRDSQNIAEVDDVVLSPDGAVEGVVATFGGFLGFGSNTVLLNMDEIEVLQDEAGDFVVHTSLTPEALEGRPDYEAAN
jgi:hypothetical protein